MSNTTTISLNENGLYPPAKRWMVTYTHEVLLVDGSIAQQYCRCFMLADSAADALAQWPKRRLGEFDGRFHKALNPQAVHVPDAAAFTLGYYRFA